MTKRITDKLVSLAIWTLALGATATFAGITQAGPTCIDSLEGKTYSCLAVEEASTTPVCITFDAAPIGPQFFGTLEANQGEVEFVADVSCGCKALGSIAAPRFNEHKDELLCTAKAFLPLEFPAAALDGQITGNGSAVFFEAVSGSNGQGAFFSCTEASFCEP